MQSSEAVSAWWANKTSEADDVLTAAGVSAAWWSFENFGDGIVQDEDDINQCVRIIGQVPMGYDPHRARFASNVYEYLDKPISEASPLVVAALVSAVELWEPRATLESLTVVPYSRIAELSVKADWSIAGQPSSVVVELGASA